MHQFEIRFEATFSPVALNHNDLKWITSNGYTFEGTNENGYFVYLKTKVMEFPSRHAAERWVDEQNHFSPPTLRIIGCIEKGAD